MLEKNVALTHLDLSDSKIGRKGGKIIAAAMKVRLCVCVEGGLVASVGVCGWVLVCSIEVLCFVVFQVHFFY